MHPLPDLTGPDVAFGCISFAPKMADLPEDFQRERHPHCDVAQTLFFEGGKLADHGLTPREGVDMGKAMNALGALLRSFEPKHEHKIAAAGFLIDQWFEPHEMEHEDAHNKRTSN